MKKMNETLADQTSREGSDEQDLNSLVKQALIDADKKNTVASQTTLKETMLGLGDCPVPPYPTAPPAPPDPAEFAPSPEPETVDEEEVPLPYKRSGRKTVAILGVALAMGVIGLAVIAGRLLHSAPADQAMDAKGVSGSAKTDETAATSATGTSVTAVPKDTDASKCEFVGTAASTWRDGWCKGRAPGAYLLSDDTLAYCSCSTPRNGG